MVVLGFENQFLINYLNFMIRALSGRVQFQYLQVQNFADNFTPVNFSQVPVGNKREIISVV